MVKKFSFLPLILICVFSLSGQAQSQSLEKADSLAERGVQLSQQADYKRAASLMEQALSIYKVRNDSAKWIRYSLEYGEALVDQAKFDEGLDVFEHLETLNHPSITIHFKAQLQNDIGWTYSRIDRLEEAAEYYQKSLSMSVALGDSSQLATVNNNLALVYQKRGKYQTALKYQEKAVRLYKAYTTPYKIAIGYNNLGLIYVDLGLFKNAQKSYAQSIHISEVLNNPDLLGMAYYNLAILNKKLGDLDEALIYFERSLTNRRKAGNPSKTSYTLSNIGNLYLQLGDTDKAISYFNEALALNRKYNGPRWTSSTLVSLGYTLANQGEYDQAQQYYLEALKLQEEIGNPRIIGQTYIQLASVAENMKEYAKARQLVSKARAIGERESNPSLLVNVFTVKGQTYRELGKKDSSLAMYRKAYFVAQNLPKYQHLTPTYNLARAFRRSASDSAFYYGNKTISLMEEYRDKAGFLSILKAGFFEGFSSFYKDMADWYLQDKNDSRMAFDLVEAAKARALADELARSTNNISETLPEKVRISYNEKSREIEDLFDELQTHSTPDSIAALENRLRDAELNFAAYMNQMENDFPSLKKLSSPSPIVLSSAQALIDKNTAVLEYAFTSDGLLVFMITTNDIQVKKVDITKGRGDDDEMTKLVEQFRDQILAHAPVEQLHVESAPLVKYLITPFYKDLSVYSNLMIIPDGVLTYLPFGALSVQDHYLVEQFSIKYAPSFTSYSMLSRSDNLPAHPKDLLAVAGSQFSSSSGPLNRGKAFQPLPATIAEVDSIASKFKNVALYKDGTYSEAFIKKQLAGNFRFIHLATHGVINEDYPAMSGLLLSPTEEDSSVTEDGILRSSEIYQLNINSDMVVLSACNTGLGKMVEGEGMLGLQRSFFYAGVPTLTVSLWNIYDRSTAYFMDTFYTSLLDSKNNLSENSIWNNFLHWMGWNNSSGLKDAAHALQQAKQQMIKNPLYSHPVYWAGFIVVGR